MASSNSKRTEARANAAIDRYVFGNPDEEVGRAAVGYVRVSTHEQAERGMSLPAQRVAVASTGLIGVRLPMDPLLTGVGDAHHALSGGGGQDATRLHRTSTRLT